MTIYIIRYLKKIILAIYIIRYFKYNIYYFLFMNLNSVPLFLLLRGPRVCIHICPYFSYHNAASGHSVQRAASRQFLQLRQFAEWHQVPGGLEVGLQPRHQLWDEIRTEFFGHEGTQFRCVRHRRSIEIHHTSA